MPKNWSPDWLNSASSLVEISKARAVHAFLIEISTLPIHARSMRTCATRLPPASTTAMFIGWPISSALRSPASITRRASVRVIAIAPSNSMRRSLDGVQVSRHIGGFAGVHAKHRHRGLLIHLFGILNPLDQIVRSVRQHARNVHAIYNAGEGRSDEAVGVWDSGDGLAV